MGRRVALLVMVTGVLVGAALALLPVSYSTSASGRSGGGIYGGFWGGGTYACGSAAPAFFTKNGRCHELARDRLTVAGVVGGVLILGGAAGAMVFRP